VETVLFFYAKISKKGYTETIFLYFILFVVNQSYYLYNIIKEGIVGCQINLGGAAMKNLIFVLIISLFIYLILAMPSFKMAKVSGHSMDTTLADGDILIINTTATPEVNDIVSVKLDDGYVVKRIAEITDEGMYLLGDNSAVSYDSRHYGYVPVSKLDGVVVFYF
jgi:signal peptidase I